MKYLIPIFYFLFGMLMHLGQTTWLNSIDSVDIEMRVRLNQVNELIFIVLPILIFLIVIVLAVVKKKFSLSSLLYLVYLAIGLYFSSYYWILYLTWM